MPRRRKTDFEDKRGLYGANHDMDGEASLRRELEPRRKSTSERDHLLSVRARGGFRTSRREGI